MKKSILVTGVSGVGKSTISKKLHAHGFRAYDIDDIPDLFQMVEKSTGRILGGNEDNGPEWFKNAEWLCNVQMLAEIIKNETAETTFYCGNASNIHELIPLFDRVLILVVSPETMKHRLTTRTENDYGRTEDIQDWILTWKDWWENDMKEKGAVAINADQDLEVVVEDILKKA